MGSIISTIIIGIGLSMDAFSLALFYGTIGLNKYKKIILSLIVSIFHFFMPLLGLLLGNSISNLFYVNINVMLFVIFSVIGIEMIISSIRGDDIRVFTSILGFFLIGFSVSIDSFTTGIGLNYINSNYLEVSFIFSFISGLFTYMGILLGDRLNMRYGKYSTIGGGIILIIMGIYYLI